MNILVLVASYPPVTTSSARLYSELSESLVEMGHCVTVITPCPAKGDMLVGGHEYVHTKKTEKARGVNVLRVPSLAVLSKIPGGKPFRFIISALLFSLGGVIACRPDVILVYSPPIFMGVSGTVISRLKRSRYVFNLQDIHPKVLFETGAVTNPLFMLMLSRMEEISYRWAHSFIVYSEGNKAYLRERGIDKEIYVIPNWVDTAVTLGCDAMQSMFRNRSVGKNFVVSYAGSMQEEQGLEVVVKTGDMLRGHEDIEFLMAGEGSSKPNLQTLIENRELGNVRLFPVMPRDRYLQFVCSSDVCLVTLSPDVPPQTVPGKLSEIMACGKPIIAVVNERGDAASIVKEARCGLCVAPGDVASLAQAVLKLYRDEDLRKEMAENGKRYADAHFSRAMCTKKFEEALRRAHTFETRELDRRGSNSLLKK